MLTYGIPVKRMERHCFLPQSKSTVTPIESCYIIESPTPVLPHSEHLEPYKRAFFMAASSMEQSYNLHRVSQHSKTYVVRSHHAKTSAVYVGPSY